MWRNERKNISKEEGVLDFIRKTKMKTHTHRRKRPEKKIKEIENKHSHIPTKRIQKTKK